eukprot:CAMPEP_0177598650 /NCGR_PEP_ID=MMETSP0419_2-20121207/12492_1 /TAXON_ID=582737 /ORGANISM="Tetraselmis sp., Strain GSL018" /LENGTH=64 /DNA_ID=CAMNT_0019091169 /DNA_START=735 /DNA_END=925 /DNA_ORIENTATION=+
MASIACLVSTQPNPRSPAPFHETTIRTYLCGVEVRKRCWVLNPKLKQAVLASGNGGPSDRLISS